MSKNLYRVCKKSDLDEIIKNNFFKPICIIFTTKDTEKDFEDNVAGLFKTLAKQNTYCMHLLINLDNFIDNINFFGKFRNESSVFHRRIATPNHMNNFITVKETITGRTGRNSAASEFFFVGKT